MGKEKNITNSEIIVMKVIWKEKDCTAAEIVDEVSKNSAWHYRTIKTLLRNLVGKGFAGYNVDEHDSRIYHYYPIVSEEEYLKQEREHFVDVYYDGKVSTMIAGFLKDSKISKSEIKELKQMLNMCNDNENGERK